MGSAVFAVSSSPSAARSLSFASFSSSMPPTAAIATLPLPHHQRSEQPLCTMSPSHSQSQNNNVAECKRFKKRTEQSCFTPLKASLLHDTKPAADGILRLVLLRQLYTQRDEARLKCTKRRARHNFAARKAKEHWSGEGVQSLIAAARHQRPPVAFLAVIGSRGSWTHTSPNMLQGRADKKPGGGTPLLDSDRAALTSRAQSCSYLPHTCTLTQRLQPSLHYVQMSSFPHTQAS
mmetsp:Transcript_37002/g.92935  ORF Transcript_37002/g.92935 Transcript_37002/m.92935 type:complete len:234 (-) Transcript_37002:88-789(-)